MSLIGWLTAFGVPVTPLYGTVIGYIAITAAVALAIWQSWEWINQRDWKSGEKFMVFVPTMFCALVGIVWIYFGGFRGDQLDARSQIKEWLDVSRIPLDDDMQFQFVVSDAENNPIEIFQNGKDVTVKNEPTITIASSIQVVEPRHLKILDEMTREGRQQLKNDLEIELLRINVEVDGPRLANWDIRITRHLVFDKTVTRQRFLDELQRVNQGIEIVKHVLRRYLH